MKTRLSVALNILLVAALGVLAISTYVSDAEYRQTIKVILLYAAKKIDAGKPELVSSILKEVPRHPNRDQLFSMVKKLAEIETTEQAVAPNRSLPHSQKSMSPIRGPED